VTKIARQDLATGTKRCHGCDPPLEVTVAGLEERAAGSGSDRVGTAEPRRRAFRQEGDRRIGNGDDRPRIAERALSLDRRAFEAAGHDLYRSSSGRKGPL